MEKSAGESRQSRHDLVVHRKNSKRNIFRQIPRPSQGSRKKTGRRKNRRRRVLVGVEERDIRRAGLSGEVVCSRCDCGRGSQRRSQRWGQAWSGGGELLLGKGNLKAATRALHGRVGGEAAIRQISARSDQISPFISDPKTLIDFSGLLHLHCLRMYLPNPTLPAMISWPHRRQPRFRCLKLVNQLLQHLPFAM